MKAGKCRAQIARPPFSTKDFTRLNTSAVSGVELVRPSSVIIIAWRRVVCRTFSAEDGVFARLMWHTSRRSLIRDPYVLSK